MLLVTSGTEMCTRVGVSRWRCGSRTGGPSTSGRSWRRRDQRASRRRRGTTTSTDGASPPSRTTLRTSTWPQRTRTSIRPGRRCPSPSPISRRTNTIYYDIILWSTIRQVRGKQELSVPFRHWKGKARPENLWIISPEASWYFFF